MNALFRFSLILALMACTCAAAPSKADVLAAIAIVEKAPASKAGRAAAKIVVTYGNESGEVAIALNSTVVPWPFDKAPVSDPKKNYDAVLMGVYLAGNIKAQIQAGVARDEPYAGWLAVIRAYRQLKTEAEISFPSIEHLEALEAQGKLKEYAAKALIEHN